MKIVIAGFGNPFVGDDAVGLKTIKILRSKKLPENVKLYYAGIDGFSFLDSVGEFDIAVIVDAVLFGKNAGEFFILPYEDINGKFNFRLSLHKESVLEIVGIAKALRVKTRFYIAGIQPKNIEFGSELSEEVSSKLEDFADRILEFVVSIK
ncbi:MAG: hydrogenase maturation protease [bacterium]|nr:hydrogenase maturation protease [bacterium]